jgi:Flp pilus assembly protein CpaB
LHVVAIASGLVAFLLFLMWMRSGQELVTIAVAGDTIRAGTIVPAGSVEFVEVSVDAAFDGRMLSPEEATRLEDTVATREITPGEPILDSDLRPVGLPAGSRAMSVPLDPNRAAGGDLAVGDRVDLVGTDDTGARYVAVGLAVLGVPGEQASTFGATNAYAVTVAVDDAEALAIAAAVDNGTVHLLRSTGAPEVAIELLVPPDTEDDPGRGADG